MKCSLAVSTWLLHLLTSTLVVKCVSTSPSDPHICTMSRVVSGLVSSLPALTSLIWPSTQIDLLNGTGLLVRRWSSSWDLQPISPKIWHGDWNWKTGNLELGTSHCVRLSYSFGLSLDQQLTNIWLFHFILRGFIVLCYVSLNSIFYCSFITYTCWLETHSSTLYHCWINIVITTNSLIHSTIPKQ